MGAVMGEMDENSGAGDFARFLKGYHIVGRHSAVKSCLWLKKALRGEGHCYKSKFYGIASHRCIQMTPSIFCNQRCVHCWRPLEILSVRDDEISDKWEWDSPSYIVEGCISEQLNLISGYKGYAKTSSKMFEESSSPAHAAISLIGEPTLYPYLDELIEEFHRRGFTTFVVTNGTHPDVLAKIKPTQLYLSLNAPDEEIYQKISHATHWHRILSSLDVMRNKKSVRTVVRITCIRGFNMIYAAKYAELLTIAKPDFIEVKAYMHLGFSRRRLRRDAMPSHHEVRDFAWKIVRELREIGESYDITDESEISRVVLISSGRTGHNIQTPSGK